MPYKITQPTMINNEMYIDLDPSYTGKRIGPGEMNGFMGKESLIQMEMSSDNIVVGVRIRFEIGRDDSSYINAVAPKPN